jgi:ABC-type molybdenum transport system ATPase subunit/photorepair protein PhrA
MDESRLPRVRKVTLGAFKHYNPSGGGSVCLDFDGADVVLLTGPNGAGKTSIIEALELAVTGDIARRVGAAADSNGLETFLYSNAGAAQAADKATVSVEWTTGAVSTLAFTAKGVQGEPLLAGDVAVASPNVVRAQTFLYSDSLGSILGMDEKARKAWLDAFLPQRQRLLDLQSSVRTLEALRVRLLSNAQEQLDAVRTAERLDIAAAKSVPDPSTTSAGGAAQAGLVTAKGVFNEKLTLTKWLHGTGLRAESIPGGKLDELEANALLGLAQAFDELVAIARDAELRAARQRSSEAAGWTLVAHAVGQSSLVGRDEIPSSADLEATLATMPAPAEVATLKGRREGELRTLAQRLDAIWLSAPLQYPGGGSRTGAVGTAPLLAAWRYLVQTAPEAVARLGLPSVTDEDLAELERLEWEAWRSATEEHAGIKSQVSVLDQQSKVLDQTASELLTVNSLEFAWFETTNDPLPKAVSGGTNLKAIRERAATHRDPKSGHGPSRASELERLAEAFRHWAAARHARDDVRRETVRLKHWTEVSKRLDAAKALIGEVAKLDSSVRKRHIEERYQVPINTAVQRVLAAYAHRRRVREHVHVYFDAKDALRVAVGDGASKTRSQRGLMSLSRSQSTSALMAIALATNLGQDKPRLGFVCLDDVSDALDLDNLAADAQLFRQLAYGRGRRRQLILTNHNEEITDRLVPRLLPPAGRTMRIIELTPKHADGDTQVKHWDLRPEPSPPGGSEGRPSRLRDLLPPSMPVASNTRPADERRSNDW